MPGPPNNNAAVIIVAVLVLLVAGGGALLWKLTDGGSEGDSTITMPTVPTFPTPATDDGPLPQPSFRPFSSPDPYSPPDTGTPPDTYTPPPQYFGAIAVARDGSIGRSWDYSTRAAAERRALNSCPRSNCRVLTVFVNGCGAVAYNPRTNKYWGGNGDTRTAAQKDAISNAGGGRWIAWVCTTR